MHPYITVSVSLSCAALSGAMAFLGFEYMREGVGLYPAIAFPISTMLLFVPFWFVSDIDEAEEDSVFDLYTEGEMGYRPATEEELSKINTGK